jgi:8-oxo-dGTP pyrophosphatase MutT (NUDIX family)
MSFAEFIKIKYIGAGIVFVTPQKEILLLQKENGKYTFPGGHREEDEYSPLETAQRECIEEIGLMPEGDLVGKLKITKEGEKQPVYSFFMVVRDSFMPTLSWEHIDYKWINYKKVKPERLTSVFKSYWGLYKKFITELP